MGDSSGKQLSPLSAYSIFHFNLLDSPEEIKTKEEEVRGVPTSGRLIRVKEKTFGMHYQWAVFRVHFLHCVCAQKGLRNITLLKFKFIRDY